MATEPQDSLIDSLMTDPGRSGEPRVSPDPNSIPPQNLASTARRVLAGELPLLPEGDQRWEDLERWLRWAQSGDKRPLMRWSRLTLNEKMDRDQYVLDLWRSIADPKSPNHGLIVWIEKYHAPWEYYRRHFFGWFLGRFDLGAARAVYSDNFLARWFHPLWAGLAIAMSILGVAQEWHFTTSVAALLGFASLTLIVGLGFRYRRQSLPLHAYFQSLIPRLGAAVGVGYLFLISTSELVQILDALDKPPAFFIASSVGLILISLLYIAFHIARRVHPQPGFGRLLKSSASVLFLAVGYSAVELLAVGPLLFSPLFLCGAHPDPKTCIVHGEPYRLALCAAIALNLGVILQLAWDEKPLTEPL
ncbi:MAG TPA: hypothetical protein VGM86_15735 [Thermoanaerobaculia bacterium]|jgi:hypothetical protein